DIIRDSQYRITLRYADRVIRPVSSPTNGEDSDSVEASSTGDGPTTHIGEAVPKDCNATNGGEYCGCLGACTLSSGMKIKIFFNPAQVSEAQCSNAGLPPGCSVTKLYYTIDD